MRRCLSIVVFSLTFFIHNSWAGQTCSDITPGPEVARKAFTLALKTREALETSGGQVALIARVGQDLSKYGLRYSHLGIVWRDHPQGRWLVIHLLNQCGTAESDLFNEGLANFYLDDLFAWDALIVVPSASLQQKIASSLSDRLFIRLHEQKYNMLAFPFSTLYQNSNQWALESIADAVMGHALDRKEVQDWLKTNNYLPTTLEISTMTRLGARMFRANVAFDDHPFDRRMAGQIDTVTVESIYKFLAKFDPLGKRIFVNLP